MSMVSGDEPVLQSRPKQAKKKTTACRAWIEQQAYQTSDPETTYIERAKLHLEGNPTLHTQQHRISTDITYKPLGVSQDASTANIFDNLGM